jgi:hypothetical protein
MKPIAPRQDNFSELATTPCRGLSLFVRSMRRADTLLPRKLMRAFRHSVEEHFTGIATAFGSRLERLSPSLYGFFTDHAVVTVGIYHGHLPGMCVKLRERQAGDVLAVNNDRDIGLGNIVAFSDSAAPQHGHPEGYWTEASLDAEVRALADQLVCYGRPFVTNPKADWKGLRNYIKQQVKKALEEAPWLREYQKA